MPRRNRPTVSRHNRRKRALASVENARRWQAKAQTAKLRRHHAGARVTENGDHR